MFMMFEQIDRMNYMNDCINVFVLIEYVQAIGDQIYKYVYQLYPDYAPKLTGMILQKGLDVARGYLNNPQQLKKIVDDAANTLKMSMTTSVCVIYTFKLSVFLSV